MSKYKYLLFDIDDNLLDFQASEDIALGKMFTYVGLEDSPEVRARYHRYNRAMWSSLEKGYISREYLFLKRFASFLDKIYDIQVDNPQTLDDKYQTWLSQEHRLIPGALETLQTLKTQGYHLYVVTNGVASTQKQRLKDSGLNQYFEKVFISEEIGAQKPALAFFDYVFAHSEAKREESLVLGDTLSSDILGANNAGIDSVWFNPKWQPNHSEAKPTYAIKRWSDLGKFLEA
ncbi:YjjG family noncanonical pyrimidine nucleotidase [Ligilactobacillus equi]|nr:YjjG family noncanonical pyrimidine nucleotidase [Ligilactobacillus equi]MCQ2556830.1 YjjG family noncanonical pyrimidine nucleotidase [Ligilactobacillus sp.]